MSDELWKWSATELARAIRDRDISAREATQSALERVHSVNPKLNAIVDLMAEEALAAADGADAAAGRGELFGPLHGVPVTLKINVDVAGRATTNGVVAFKDRIARDDSPVVASWRRAGAIFIGRTNVPAFSTRYFTDCELHGRTLNPWDPRRTPGGSSGGAAACVATGMGAIAHGNDRAGSVRYPAYACGVFGIRPSLGRVPTFEGTSPEEIAITTQLCHTQGVLARTVDDLRLGLETTIAGDPKDPWWVPVPLRNEVHSPGRIALSMQKAAPEVQAALRHAAKWLEDAGYRVGGGGAPGVGGGGGAFLYAGGEGGYGVEGGQGRHVARDRGVRRRAGQAGAALDRGFAQAARLRGLYQRLCAPRGDPAPVDGVLRALPGVAAAGVARATVRGG